MTTTTEAEALTPEIKSERQASNPAIASSMSELLTPKQLVAIYRIAGSKGLNANQTSMAMFQSAPEGLTKRAASKLIDRLNAQPGRKLEALRSLAKAAEEKPAPQPCCWCVNVQAGDFTSTAIPKKSAPKCIAHLALDVEWSRRIWEMAQRNENLAPLLDEITARGIEIAQKTQAGMAA